MVVTATSQGIVTLIVQLINLIALRNRMYRTICELYIIYKLYTNCTYIEYRVYSMYIIQLRYQVQYRVQSTDTIINTESVLIRGYLSEGRSYFTNYMGLPRTPGA